MNRICINIAGISLFFVATIASANPLIMTEQDCFSQQVSQTCVPRCTGDENANCVSDCKDEMHHYCQQQLLEQQESGHDPRMAY